MDARIIDWLVSCSFWLRLPAIGSWVVLLEAKTKATKDNLGGVLRAVLLLIPHKHTGAIQVYSSLDQRAACWESRRGSRLMWGWLFLPFVRPSVS